MTYSTAALIFAIIMVISGSLIFLIRKFVPIEFLQAHHDVAFVIFLQIGVIYGVLLAFVVSETWNQYNSAYQRTVQEASNLTELAHLKFIFPPTLQKTIEWDLIHYFNAVINREWILMARGQEDPQTGDYLEDLQKTYFQFKPHTFGESDLYTESLKHLASIREYRSLRLFETKMLVPRIMWLILIVMGISVVGVSYFFGMRYVWSQAVLIMTLVAMITSLLLLIKLLDNPFAGDLRVRPIAFQNAEKQIASFL